MNLTPLTVYFILQADALTAGFLWTGVVISLFLAAGKISAWIRMGCAQSAIQEKETYPNINRDVDPIRLKNDLNKAKADFHARRIIPACLVFSLTIIFYAALPSTKTLAAMFVVPAIAQSDFVKKDAPELYDMAINKLKEQLREK